MHGRMNPSLAATHVFGGFDRLEEALLLMKKPVHAPPEHCRIDGNDSGHLTPEQYAAMGIRTPVAGVRVLHDWPVYTIAAHCTNVLYII